MDYNEITKRLDVVRSEIADHIPWRVAMKTDLLNLLEFVKNSNPLDAMIATYRFGMDCKNGKYKKPVNYPPGSFQHFKQVWDSIK